MVYTHQLPDNLADRLPDKRHDTLHDRIPYKTHDNFVAYSLPDNLHDQKHDAPVAGDDHYSIYNCHIYYASLTPSFPIEKFPEAGTTIPYYIIYEI